MRFKKKYSTGALAMAVFHGFLMGIGGVLLFGFIVMSGDGIGSKAKEGDGTVPVDAPADGQKADGGKNEEGAGEPTANRKTAFFAVQHGVFSTGESAQSFIAANGNLRNAAIFPVDGQFYLWSSVHLTDSEAKDALTADTFVKPFTLDAAACPADGDGKLPVLLAGKELASLKFEDPAQKAGLPKDWDQNIGAVAQISDEMSVIRLQLIGHYLPNSGCLKIEF
ncbi:hypothetical protein ACFFIY_11495 [Bhargavaea ullalensis]|uniref:Uncharacterized protein n=1 Tax=Bhargavaea ullalensis TaxID=1265685 RepID=A0ABV2G8M7_9BACL